MKNIWLLLLILPLAACAAPAAEPPPIPDSVEVMAPAPQTEESLYLGIAATAHIAKSMHATYDFPGYARTEVTVAAVIISESGIIRACTIDGISAIVPFDATGALQLSENTVFLSKTALGTDYGMHKASPLGTEWYQQATDFAASCVGKDHTQLHTADAVTSVTISTDGLLQAVRSAAANAHTLVSTAEPPTLFCRAAMTGSFSAAIDDGAPGLARLRASALACTPGGVSASCALISAVPFTASGRIACDLSLPLSPLSDVLMPADVTAEELLILQELAAAAPQTSSQT